MSDLYDQYEAEWQEYRTQRQRLEALTIRVNGDLAARVDQIAAAEPHMSPGVVLAAAESGSDDDTVAYLAMEDADMLREDPLYKRIASNVGNAALFGVRAGLSALQGVGTVPFKYTTAFLTANDRVAQEHGLGVLNPMNWRGEMGQALDEYGPSPIETQMAAVLRGEETDWRLSGDVWAEHYQRREGLTTPGAFTANGIFQMADGLGVGNVVEPGTRAYDFTRALVDLGFELGTDPTLFAGKTAQIAISGRRTFAALPAAQRGALAESVDRNLRINRQMGLVDGGARRTVLPEISIDNWLSSREGAMTVDWLSQSEDFLDIFNRVKNTEAALALRDAQTADEIRDVVQVFAGRGIQGPISAPLSLRIERAVENTRIARIWDQAVDLMPDMPNWTRFGKWTPKYDPIPLSQPTEAVEQFTRWFQNWEAPKEVTGKLVERFARAVVAGDRNSAWGVWKDANEELAIRLRDLGHDKDVVRSLTRMLGGPDFSTGTNQRAYWMEAAAETGTDLMRGYDQVFDGETWWRHVSPHSVVELMDEAIPMPNLLELRRATSQLTRLSKVPRNESQIVSDVYEVLFGLGPEFAGPGKMKGLVWSSHDFMWAATTKAWMPLALVTRIAWPMRVTLEEQLRMGATGLDAMFQHPISYIGWAMGNPESSRVSAALSRAGVTNRGLVDALGDPIAQSRQFQDAMVVNRPRMYGGPSQVRPGATAWDAIDMTRANVGQQVTAFRIGMGKMWKDDVKQRVAEAVLAGDNQLDTVFEWFYESNLHRGMMRTSDEFSQLLETPQGVMRWLQSQANELRQLTGGDTELIESVATRTLRGREVMVNNLDKKWINKTIAEKINELRDAGSLHRFWVVPQDVISGVDKTGVWDQVTNQLFYLLGAVPSNVLSRAPVFREGYWQEMTRLMDYADPQTQRRMLQSARDANIPNITIRDMTERLTPIGRLPGPEGRTAVEMAETAGRVADVPSGRFVQSVEEADLIAKEYALRQVNTLLYQLNERGQTMAAMRLIFPFGEAWKEIGLTWARLLGTNAHNLRRGQILIDGARQGGFMYVDPITGEESYTSPGTGLLAFATGIDRALPEGTRQVASSPLQGVNLFANSALPGIGPVFNSILGATLPDNTEAWADFRNMIMPFGSLSYEPEDLIDPNTITQTLLPSWMKKAMTAILEDGFDDRTWRSHVSDSVRVLSAGGEYGNSDAEIRRLSEDAEDLAKKTLWFRALGQAILPTGYRVDFQVAPDSPEAAQMARNLLGEDVDFGREDGGYLSMTVLSGVYYQLLQEADGDSFQATQAFLTMFGTTPDDYDLYQWVAALGTGKTVALTGRAQDWKGRLWEEENSELIDEIPAVIGMFAPVDEENPLDIAAYLRSIELGERYSLTGEQFIIASQKIIGSAIWRETVRQTDGVNNPAARAFRANRQAWLDENLPYWRRDRVNVGVPQGYSWFQQMEQLEKAVTFDAVTNTPAGGALQRYMEARENVIQGLIQGLPDVNNREQAQIALERRNQTAPLRTRLRQYGETLVAETGEFDPIWNRILLREVQSEEVDQ